MSYGEKVAAAEAALEAEGDYPPQTTHERSGALLGALLLLAAALLD